MKRSIGALLVSGFFVSGMTAHAGGIYLEETVKTSGISGSKLDGEKRIWISNSKSREMSRASAEASKEIAETKKGLVGMAANSGMASNCDMQLKSIDDETAGLSRQIDQSMAGGFANKADKEKMLAQQRAKKEKLKADCAAGDQQGQTKDQASRIGNSVDTSGKADQKASLKVVITRVDDGKIWDINTKDMLYSEVSAADEKARREKKASKMQVGKGMSVSMKEIAGEKIAGYQCKGYEIVASMNGMPLFTGQYWAAQDLAEAGDEYRAFETKYNKTFGADPDNPLMQMIYSDMDWAREYREKVTTIKGLVLKKTLKLTPPDMGAMAGGAMGGGMGGMLGGMDIQAKMAAAMKNLPAGMGMPAGTPAGMAGGAGAGANPMGGPMSATFEATKVNVGPVEDKQFELPPAVKKL